MNRRKQLLYLKKANKVFMCLYVTGRRFKNERELVQWENVIADAFHHKTQLRGSESMEYKVNSTHDR